MTAATHASSNTRKVVEHIQHWQKLGINIIWICEFPVVSVFVPLFEYIVFHILNHLVLEFVCRW